MSGCRGCCGRGRRRKFRCGRSRVSWLTANEIVKEQMFQTTSKKIVRSSEKQKPRACLPHTPYVRTEGFVRATACYDSLIVSIHLFSNNHFSTSYKKLGLIFLSIGNCLSFFFMVSKKYR